MKWTEEKINILKEGVNNKLTYEEIENNGALSERLGGGLQHRIHWFKSSTHLKTDLWYKGYYI